MSVPIVGSWLPKALSGRESELYAESPVAKA